MYREREIHICGAVAGLDGLEGALPTNNADDTNSCYYNLCMQHIHYNIILYHIIFHIMYIYIYTHTYIYIYIYVLVVVVVVVVAVVVVPHVRAAPDPAVHPLAGLARPVEVGVAPALGQHLRRVLARQVHHDGSGLVGPRDLQRRVQVEALPEHVV